MTITQINSIIIIESLKNCKTGEMLYRKLKNELPASFYIDYYFVRTKKKFMQKIKLLKNVIRDKKLRPIIHLEIHGLIDTKDVGIGLSFADKSHLLWEELECFREINIITENNLILGMAVCGGVYSLQLMVTEPVKETPFFGIFAAVKSIDNSDILEIFSRFYYKLIVRYFENKSNLPVNIIFSD